MCRKNDEREIYMSSFFHNAKYFFEISKSTLPYKINEKNPILYKDITILRNFFAHAYDKDFLDSKYFVKIEENHSHEN